MNGTRSIDLRDRLREASWWPPYAILAGWLLLSALGLYVFTAHEQSVNPPSCYGIGWGCTPDPGSAVALYLMFVAPPFFLAASVVVALIGLVGPNSRRVRLALASGLPPLAIAVIYLAA